MRTWVWNVAKATPGLPAGITESKIMSSGSADNPVAPFVLISMGVEQQVLGMPASAKTSEVPFDLWVHDRPGSMVNNIDKACFAFKDYLPTLVGVRVGNLVVLEIRWEEIGPDQKDDHFGTMTRRCSFRAFTSSRIPVG